MIPTFVQVLFAAATATHPGPVEHNPDSPLAIDLDGPSSVTAGSEIELVLDLARPLPDAVPLAIALRVPAGVTVLKAPEPSLVDAASPVVVRVIRLRIDQVPSDDLIVTIDAQTRAYGVHAVATYRFGRPAPAPVRAALGAEMRGPGGVSLGRPVIVERPATPTPQVPGAIAPGKLTH